MKSSLPILQRLAMPPITNHQSPITPLDLWTIVPVRGIAEGKSRLAGVLDPAARAELNRQLLEHTLRTVAGWRGALDRCAIVSACRESLAIAGRLGAVIVDEGSETGGLNAAAARGAAYAAGRGAQSILVLPCDLPYLSAAALAAMAGCTGVGTAPGDCAGPAWNRHQRASRERARTRRFSLRSGKLRGARCARG